MCRRGNSLFGAAGSYSGTGVKSMIVKNRLSNNVGGVKHFASVLIPALRGARHFALVEAVPVQKDRMRERDAQPHDLVFPNGQGKPDGHFLRRLKAICQEG